MTTISRSLLTCSFLAVLSGCTTPSCGPPTMLSKDPTITCFYQIQVTGKDPVTNSVTGKVPDILVIEDAEEDAKKEEGRRTEFASPKSTNAQHEYTFRVSHFEKLSDLIVIGHTYEFMRVGNYPDFGLGKEVVPKQKK